MRKQQIIKLNILLALLGIAVVCGVFFYTQKPAAGSDSRVTMEEGATASVQPQTDTYAQEFPSTQNDYLGSAQRFTLFGNDITVGNSVLGNVAATTINSAGNDIKTEDQMHDQLVTGTGEDSGGRDIFYYQNISNQIPKLSGDANQNPKLVLGSTVSGIHVTTNSLPFEYQNGNDLIGLNSNGRFYNQVSHS